MFLGRAKDDDNNDRVFLENDAELVVQSLESGDLTEYFFIRIQANAVTLQPVSLKAGPRAPGSSFDIAEIQANGVVVGSAEVVR